MAHEVSAAFDQTLPNESSQSDLQSLVEWTRSSARQYAWSMKPVGKVCLPVSLSVSPDMAEAACRMNAEVVDTGIIVQLAEPHICPGEHTLVPIRTSVVKNWHDAPDAWARLERV